jgi:hypothetical protein
VSIFTKIGKRSATPVELSVGLFHLREMTIGECERIRAAPESIRDNLVLALSLVDESGALLMPQQDGETDEQLSERMKTDCKDISVLDMERLATAIEKLLKPANAEKLAKN